MHFPTFTMYHGNEEVEMVLRQWKWMATNRFDKAKNCLNLCWDGINLSMRSVILY